MTGRTAVAAKSIAFAIASASTTASRLGAAAVAKAFSAADYTK